MGREDDRLHLLYEVTRRLATFTDLDELLRYATGRARELLDAEGAAVMLLDPARPPAADDLEFLETLASDIAVAHEKAALHERLRGEVIGLRQVCRVAGLGLLALGALLAFGAVYVQLGLALPVRELPTRPGVLDGLLCLLVGAL